MKILLVDDDSSIIQALLPVLKSTAHEVHVAISGAKALERAPAIGGLDLLITDVVMDPLDGFTLQEQLVSWYPQMKTIFISGYDLSEYGDRLSGAPLLQKPFDADVLLTAVRKASGEETMVNLEAAAVLDLERADESPEHAALPPAEPLAMVEGTSAPVVEPEASRVTEVPAPELSGASESGPVVHSAAPHGGSPSVAESDGSTELTQGSFVPALNLGGRAAAEPSPLTSTDSAEVAAQAVEAPAPVSTSTFPAAGPVPVARPLSVPGATTGAVPRVAAAAPGVKATAAGAKPVVRATAPSAAPRATAVPVPVARAASAVPVTKPAVAGPAVKVASAVPVARSAGGTPVAKAAPAVRAAVAVRAPGVSVPKAVAAPAPLADAERTPSTTAHLIGQTVGGYQIVSHLGDGRWGGVYAAVQTSINRPVGLKLLDPTRATDELQKQRFIADARAKAHVQHPGILSVYEAGSAENWIFYTHEYVDGQSLAEMAAAQRKIDEPTALKLLKTAADGLAYMAKNNIPHTPFQASDIFLGIDGQPRLANLATQFADQAVAPQQEIESLGRATLAVLGAGAEVSAGLRALLGRTLRTNNGALKDWNLLLQGIKALEPKIVPVEAAKISAQERAAVLTMAKARKQQKRAFLMNVVALLSLLLFAVLAVYFVWIRSNERQLDEQVQIPAGEFIAGTGEPAQTKEFWIDKYEVTIGQYAKFVRWVEANEGDQHTFNHPKQPRQLSHIPDEWKIYFSQAQRGGAAHGVPISLNSPMLGVSWWDAYAYAKWQNRELPTEMEWEKASRGLKGLQFPWGEDADAKKANTNADYNPRIPKAKGNIDGFNFWSDVDALKGDKSPFGVIGMAGNVSEWTATWLNQDRNPVVKGGNFSIGLQPMNVRIETRLPADREEFIGFRTISHTAPIPK